MTRRRLASLSSLVLLVLVPAVASSVERDGDARVTFSGKGPAGFRIEGKSPELSLKESADAWTFSVPLATLKTGIDLRDRHLREKYLEVDKYPDAVLVLPKSAVALPEEGKSASGTAEGTFTLRGKSRKIPVRYTVARSQGRYDATGQLALDIRHYGIAIPSYMGVTVKPDIDASVAFGFR